MNKHLKQLVFATLLLTVWLTVFLPVQAQVLIEGTLLTLDGKAGDQSIHAVPGQVVRMNWQLGSDSWFTQPPLMPHWQAEGAVIMPSSQEEGNFSRRSGRTTFSGVNRYYWVVPEKPGVIRIAPHEVWLTRAFEEEAQPYKTPALTLEVDFPDNYSSSKPFFPASNVEIEQSLSSTDELSVGDQVVRTITLSAGETLGSLIPAMDAVQSTEGIQGYLESTDVSNKTVSRGQLSGGQRTEIWVYRLDQGGEMTLPAIEVEWWDLHDQQYKRSALPAVTIEVTETAVAGEEAVLRRGRILSIPVVLNLAMLLLTLAGIGYYRQRIIAVSTILIRKVVASRTWIDITLLFTAIFGRKTTVQKRYLQWKRVNSASLIEQTLPDSVKSVTKSRSALVCQLVRLVMTLRIQMWQRKHSRHLPGLND